MESSGDVANFGNFKLVKEGGAWKLSVLSNSQARELVKKEMKKEFLSAVQAEQKSANDFAKWYESFADCATEEK